MTGKGAAAPSISRAAGPPGPANRESAALLAGLVRVQPVFNQGKLQGYRIFPGANHGASAFSQLGLRAGDLIEAVNGTPLDDAARAMEVLQTLSSSATATVTVSRNGAPQEVNLNIANLNLDADSGDNAAGEQATGAQAAAAARGGHVVSPPNLSTAPGAPTWSGGTINTPAPGADTPAAPAGGGDQAR
jgi:membrane-associated protease RseP (regulator of RpoE activity)